MRRVPVEIKEADSQITVRAEVPGFAANEINVSVEPQRLVISGKSEKTTEDQKEQTLLSEIRSNQFCRELRLPAEVDPAKTTAVLKDGVLELGLSKVAESKAVNVEVKRNNGIFPTDCGKTPITWARIPISTRFCDGGSTYRLWQSNCSAKVELLNVRRHYGKRKDFDR